jgi:hypothetical protein
VKPVLPRNESAHAIALCQEIGFDFVLQSASSRAAPQVAAVLAETPEFVTSA